MRKKIQDYIDNCLICLIANSSGNKREGEMQITEAPSKPFDVVHLDHYGPLPQADDGSKYVLVVVDAKTRYTWYFATCSTSAKETCDNLKFLWNVFGTPTEIVTDRGTAFTSREFATLIESYRIKHRKVAVASPWANGLAERSNRFLKPSLTKLSEDPNEWRLHLEKVQYVVNNTVNSSIKTTPSKLLLGFDQRNHTDSEISELVNEWTEINKDRDRHDLQEMAGEATAKIQHYTISRIMTRYTRNLRCTRQESMYSSATCK